METSLILVIIAVLCGIVGIVGSILPGLPGPPVSWVGLLVLFLGGGGSNGAGEPMSLTFLLIWLAVTVVVSVLDYIVPAKFTSLTGGSKAAGRGAIAGLLVGMFVPPVGIFLGTFLGAFLAELLVARKSGIQSVSAAIGSLLGFLFGTGLKLAAAGVMMYYIIVYIG